MNPKIISAIKALLMGLLTLLPIFGLGSYQGIIDLLIENLDPLIEAITAIISIVALFFAWRPTTDEQTKGRMVKKAMSKELTEVSAKSMSSGAKRTHFFNYGSSTYSN